MKRIAQLLVLLSALSGCWSNDVSRDIEKYVQETQASGTSSGSGTSTTSGSVWLRSSTNTKLSLSGTTAKTCSAGTETRGTYNASEPSMTYVVSGVSYKFKLRFDGNTLLVSPPNQAVDTHTATVYSKITTYSCP